ncbi:MAG: type II toxin-antitoxin system RelB/DinJ family antitoxin [Coprobacillus sp.]|nr:type II toxin-antitoxin system RelB/DinJ family antitoxin [Coprobacillus sp.]
MSEKSANINVRIEPELKEEAEAILSEVGLSPSGAINMFYKQIVLHKGLPFEVLLPEGIINMSAISEDELNKEIMKGYQDVLDGNVKPIEEVFKELAEKYGLSIKK